MQENIHPDFLQLEQIIDKEFNVKIKSRKSKRDFVYARMIFSKILRERGHTTSGIGRFLGKDHTTIVHYGITVNNILSQFTSYKSQYIKCYNEFMVDKEQIMLSVTEKNLKMYNFSLKNEVERLILENKSLTEKLDKHKRLTNIIEFIDSRTPRGKEHFMLRKINLMINGLTDYGQELEW